MSPLIVKLIGAYPVRKHQLIDYPENEFKIDCIIKRQNFI